MEKMMMPAYYNVLSTEEMTYTEGGANATMSEALLCWLIPPYGVQKNPYLTAGLIMTPVKTPVNIRPAVK
jgi:hypothetical protein